MAFFAVFDLGGDAGVAGGEVVEVGAFVAAGVVAVAIAATLGEKAGSLGRELGGGEEGLRGR